MSAELREQLAAYAHEAWSGWMGYLFSKCLKETDGSMMIPAWAVERWERQSTTAYSDLPEDEKASDRKEAERMIGIMESQPVFLAPDVIPQSKVAEPISDRAVALAQRVSSFYRSLDGVSEETASALTIKFLEALSAAGGVY